MKTMRLMNSILIGLLLMGAVQSQAVEYKSTYKGKHPQPVYIAPVTTTAPVAPESSGETRITRLSMMRLTKVTFPSATVSWRCCSWQEGML